MSPSLSAPSRLWLLGVSAAALVALAACEGPPAPEPMAAPSPPEQGYEDDEGMQSAEAEQGYAEDEDGKPPVDLAGEADEAEAQMDEGEEYAQVEPPEVVAMAPIPNPEGYDRLGRRLRDGGRDDGALRPYAQNERPTDYGQREKPPEDGEVQVADAADPAPRAEAVAPGPYAMAPIPNPEPGGRPALAGGPRQAYAQAYGQAVPPAGYVAVAPPVSETGPRVRVPIAPAVQPTRPLASNASRAASDLRGSQSPAPETRSLDDRVAAAATDLRRSVETGAVLEAPDRWAAGQTREVRLRFPEGFADRLRRSATDLGGASAEPGEITATLSGDGFRIDPSGPQSVSAAGVGQPLVWRVTPERADPGELRAEVQAVTPAGDGRRTLSLGTVGGEGAGGLDISPRTLGWGILIALVLAFVAWLASRRPDDPEGRNRRRARAEQARRERPAPLDLSPAEPRAPAT